jgi:hypothetical protein
MKKEGTIAGEGGGVATVIKQDGNRVLVSVPMAGFPPGFQLRPGERVVLVTEPSGPAARPLVRSMVVGVVPQLAGAFALAGMVALWADRRSAHEMFVWLR